MMDPEQARGEIFSSPAARRSDALRVLMEEVYALALHGRAAECLHLIDATLEGARAAGAALDIDVAALRLARARVTLSNGDDPSRAEALRSLRELAREKDATSWRAELEIARAAHADGRLQEAAEALKRALERFRERAQELGSLAPPVRDLLPSEVEFLRRGGAPLQGRSDLDPSSLLRLVELGRRLAADTDPDQVLRIVLHEAIEIARAERGFLVLLRGQDYEFALAENLDWSEVEQPSFEVSRTLIRKATTDGKPVILHLEDDPDPDKGSESLHNIGARSVACVPILHAGTALGVLYLDSRDQEHSFTSGTGRLLELFAAQSGAAIENARAHHAKERALQAAEETIRRQRSDIEQRSRYHTLIGASPPMQEVYQKLDLFTPTEMPVLVLGETGTGKELVAHLIHSGGPRAKGPFIATNCAGLSESLLESELFGHERGAFTGADRSRPGLFELAHRGTLFLDEVGDMGLRMQADLLRVLQSGELRRVGGRETIRVDVRIIAATHRDLEERIRLGEFREDLYFRLNVLSLRLPPLREHADDVPLLVTELMSRLAPPGRKPPRISGQALRKLVAHVWPGNVRELENVLRRLIVLDVPVIEERQLPPEILRGNVTPLGAGMLRKVEEAAVRAAMDAAGGNKAEAARILGVDRTTLYAKLRRFRLDL